MFQLSTVSSTFFSNFRCPSVSTNTPSLLRFRLNHHSARMRTKSDHTSAHQPNLLSAVLLNLTRSNPSLSLLGRRCIWSAVNNHPCPKTIFTRACRLPMRFFFFFLNDDSKGSASRSARNNGGEEVVPFATLFVFFLCVPLTLPSTFFLHKFSFAS